MNGLLAYMIQRGAKAALTNHEATHAAQAPDGLWSRLNDFAKRHPADPAAAQAARAGLPGPGTETQWSSAQAPSPQFKLGGMRPISGGGRRSF